MRIWKMINIVWDQGFKRIYRKKIVRNDEIKGRFWDAIKKFTKNPFQLVDIGEHEEVYCII